MKNLDINKFQCPLDGYNLKIDTSINKIFCTNKSCKVDFQIYSSGKEKIPCLIDDKNFDTVFNSSFLNCKRIFKKKESKLTLIISHVKNYIYNLSNKQYLPPYKEIARKEIKSLIKKNKKDCLVVGSGNRELPLSISNKHLNIMGCDIYPGEKVDFIADAHYLPIKNKSINFIFLQAVLEHVLEPQKVVDECFRVLSDGGLIISEAPFLQGIHENGYDFFRFSPSAHAFLFRNFHIKSYGPLMGVSLTFFWNLRGLASKYLGIKVSKLIFFPLITFFNRPTNKNIKANWDYCNSSYVVAIKDNNKKKGYYHKKAIRLYEPKEI